MARSRRLELHRGYLLGLYMCKNDYSMQAQVAINVLMRTNDADVEAFFSHMDSTKKALIAVGSDADHVDIALSTWL